MANRCLSPANAPANRELRKTATTTSNPGRTSTRRGDAALIILATFALLTVPMLGSCARHSGGAQKQDRNDEDIALVWPAPPHPPRIRYHKQVAREADLGIRPGWLARLGRLIAGRQEDWFVRPTGVAASAGRIFVTDPATGQIWILSPLEHSVLRIDSAGDDPLESPLGVCPGPSNDFYVTDSSQGRLLRYNAQTGAFVSELFGRFERPTGVAYDKMNDRLYVADSARHLIVVMSGHGSLIGEIGRRGAGDGEFNFPTFLSVDKVGVLLVTDSMGFRVQRFASDGTFLGKIGHHGNVEGDFARPKGVAVDEDGHIYVVEALFDAVQLFDDQGQLLLRFGDRGSGPGQFWLPGGIFVDDAGLIYVADSYNRRIQIFEYLPDDTLR